MVAAIKLECLAAFVGIRNVPMIAALVIIRSGRLVTRLGAVVQGMHHNGDLPVVV